MKVQEDRRFVVIYSSLWKCRTIEMADSPRYRLCELPSNVF